MLFLLATSRGAHAPADTHDNETNDHERYHDDYGNGPAGEAIAFAVGSDGRSPAVVPSFVTAVSGALVIGRAVLVLVSCAISRIADTGPPRAFLVAATGGVYVTAVASVTRPVRITSYQ